LLSGLLCACVHAPPREPYIWDDDAPLVKAKRVDVVEAEAVVVRFMGAPGAFSVPASDCKYSTRAFELFTTETAEAYQVWVNWNPNLCDAPPDVEVEPFLSPWYEGPAEYAVSKKDLHIIRMRIRSDEYKSARKEESRKESLGFLDAGYPPPSNDCDAALERKYPDGGLSKDGLISRSEFPECFRAIDLLPNPSHMLKKEEKPQRDGGVEGCPCKCLCDGGCAEGPAASGAPRAPDAGAAPADSSPLRSSPDGGFHRGGPS